MPRSFRPSRRLPRLRGRPRSASCWGSFSRGLRRGKRRAWRLETGLAGAVVLLHLVKGLDVEEAGRSAVVLVLLVAGRRRFVAASGPRSRRTTLAVALGAAAAGTALGHRLLATVDGGSPSARRRPATTS
ncbi:hypothetical protein GCM10010531_17360 [Blastococcus jejuensis]|uniref:Uncharacterized protein n=1 Tax=Blastococcus jejuensis TaxID=351224 RepID=A0ABP6P2Q1_9ACTN